MITLPAADNALQSPILIMTKRAALMRAQGRDVINLTLGEPDFNAPPHVLEAAHTALSGRLTYSPSNGIEPLRHAIRMRMKDNRNLDCADEQVTVGCGAKQIIYNAFQATLNDGDEVIVPAPYWASYPAMIKMCGARPLFVSTTREEGFRLTCRALGGNASPGKVAQVGRLERAGQSVRVALLARATVGHRRSAAPVPRGDGAIG
ncbi:aminotransferase class I/II-fold pyridoxal phosphate-dependent enzyme [Pseudomonas sp. S2_A02]